MAIHLKRPWLTGRFKANLEPHEPSLLAFESKQVTKSQARALTLYSTITPFGTIEICIWKYYGKWSICSIGTNSPFSMIFPKVFKS